MEPVSAAVSFYDEVGGHDTFDGIVSRFYALVATDPVLRPLYPEADLSGAQERLRMFLDQYWGGPHTYSERRGHPRLRMRHAPFHIGAVEHDAWLSAMGRALDGADLSPAQRDTMWNYFVMAAGSLVNAGPFG